MPLTNILKALPLECGENNGNRSGDDEEDEENSGDDQDKYNLRENFKTDSAHNLLVQCLLLLI